MPRAVIPDPVLLRNGPDLDGWRDAHNRLRLALGQDIIFFTPRASTWGSNVGIDPETGRPWDPTAVPTSGGDFDTAIVRVSVVFRPIHVNVEDPILDQPAGIMRTNSVALVAAEGDYNIFKDATRFDLNGLRYTITDIVPDGLGRIDRYVIFGEAQ